MIVFSIETSCDETSVCILNDKKEILSHIIHSQTEHIQFGGVVPEIASRAHLQILQKISKKALKDAGILISNIDIFCATCGPGLIGGLLVGSIFAKSLAIGLNKPFVPINHLEGHLLSVTFNNAVKFPFISFLLTGGHTQIYLIRDINNYELLGETLDDAVGEAFDKVAKLLGFSYPGGPEIELFAQHGNKNKYEFTEPLIKQKNLNFSFSGLKTAVSQIVKKNKILNQKIKNDISASFENIVVEILKNKLSMVAESMIKKNIIFNEVSIVGGVAANKQIYNGMSNIAKKYKKNIILPPQYMFSDNAAMIGWACIQKSLIKDFSNINFIANPRMTLGENAK